MAKIESPFPGSDSNILWNIHERWPIPDFCVTLFRDPAGTQAVRTDLCLFVLEKPMKALKDIPRLDKFRYFPPAASASQCSDSTSRPLTTNVIDYLNAKSCHENGYTLSLDG